MVNNPVAYGYSADWDMFGWWRDTMGGQLNHLALQLWLTLQPGNTAFTSKSTLLESLLNPWCNAGQPNQHLRTPGGLAYRSVYGGSFSLQWNLNNMMVAAAYGSKQNKPAYYSCAKSQIDYALGNNPVKVSYVTGYGNQWLTTLHHRGATGGWTGFDSITPGKPGYMAADRHVPYGAIPGGPNPYGADPDAAPVGRTHSYTEPGLLFSAGYLGTLAAVVATESAVGTPDSFLPPPDSRNSNTDWATSDREFFGEVQLTAFAANSQRMDVRVNNRTRWPARITTQTKLRVFFELLPGTSVADLSAAVSNGPAKLVLSQPRLWKTGIAFVDLDFSGERMSPHFVWQATTKPDKAGTPDDMYRRSASLQISFPAGKGISLTRQSLAGAGSSAYTIQSGMAVYDAGALVGGSEP